jgi:hypothetical protein
MDPLIEVSTDRGRNMRETCARVLAAALMTGAIATVVAMSALSGATGEAGRSFAAPPASLKRSVPVVQVTTPRPGSIGRHARSNSVGPRPVAVSRRLVVLRHWSPPRQLAAAKPKPKPAPAQPAPAPTPTPAPEPTPPTVEAAQLVETPQPAAPAGDQGQQQGKSDDANGDHGNGRGHAYGHDKHDE